MLERIVSRPRGLHVARALTLGGALVAGALIARACSPRVVSIAPPPVIVLPAAPLPAPWVVVQLPAPAAPEPPAPEPPTVPSSAPLPAAHVGCPSDLATIGVPLAKASADVNAPKLEAVSIAAEGCTIAARTAGALEISWDGGQSFSHVEIAGITNAVALATRVMVLRDDGTLGTLTPGDPIVWRHVPAPLAEAGLLAAGSSTVLVLDGLAGVSDDTGATWRYLEPPKGVSITQLDANGQLIGLRFKETQESDGDQIEVTTTRFTTELRHPRWRKLASTAGTPQDESGRYRLEGDKSWGCGGSSKLVTRAGDHDVTVRGDIREDVFPLAVHTRNGVTFASLSDRLVRLDGADVIEIDSMPGNLVGVDGADTPIVTTYNQILRWSKAGGWRVLL